MELQEQWNRFMESGRVEDYLNYRQAEYNKTSEHNPNKDKAEKAGTYYGSRAGRSDGDGISSISG